MPRPSERGFRHGLRVRINGEPGVLLRCESRRPGGRAYWMVRLQSNKWVWPDDIVVDGRGTERVDVCAACELPFYRRAGSGELICDRCNAESFGTATRATEPPDTKTFPRHRYPKG